MFSGEPERLFQGLNSRVVVRIVLLERKPPSSPVKREISFSEGQWVDMRNNQKNAGNRDHHQRYNPLHLKKISAGVLLPPRL